MFSIRHAQVLIGTLSLAFTFPAAAADLQLKQVMLSTGGVGYLEYGADVEGAALLHLDVRRDQVDDVLKSLVVYDPAGRVGGFELASPNMPSTAFAGLNFGADAFESPFAYLNGLVGVVVTVTGQQPMTGRLMKAEKVEQTTAGTVETNTRVSLMTDDGLKQFILEHAEAVQVADPALRARIGHALMATKGEATDTVQPIVVRVRADGAAKRQVRVGFVATAPLWKTSYRLVLQPPGKERARLQGWAVVENATATDWTDIRLALQYGNPVTFRQALYGLYYVHRPEVPVEVLGRPLPPVDTRAEAIKDIASPAPVSASAPSMQMRQAAPATKDSPRAEMSAPAQDSRASEGSQDTVFVLPGTVTLGIGRTASVPILDRDVRAVRIGLLSPNQLHPLAAIRVTNDTDTSLPAGVLTLYDPASPASFAGDARLGGLPAGESRLLSFAEDLRTGAVWQAKQTQSIAAVTAAAGILHVDERRLFTNGVTISAPANETRDLLVEIPRMPGTTLAASNAAKPIEETATAWRFAVTLAAGETKTLNVVAERIDRQVISLLANDAMVVQLLGRPDMSPPARTALARLEDLQKHKAAAAASVAQLQAQIAQLGQDEDRTRQNLMAVPVGDALHGKLVRQLETQDNRIETTRKALDQAGVAADQAQRDLVSAIGTFTL